MAQSDTPKRSNFIFCDGCGARLSESDRTCPKCGRPAPGILTSESAASDLAAGNTASLPRLNDRMIEVEQSVPKTEPAAYVNNSIDPFSTSVIPALSPDNPSISKAPEISYREPVASVSSDADPYHKRKRKLGKIVAAVMVVLLLGGGAWFVCADPMGVMPGFYQWFGQSASEMFPSREGADSSNGDASMEGESDASQSDEPASDLTEEHVCTDDELYDVLSDYYTQLVQYNSDDVYGTVLDDFEGGYLRASIDERRSYSEGAYALRDQVAATRDAIDGLMVEEDTAYVSDIANLSQLANWMYTRIDAYCQCWDISLSYETGVSSHNDEILEPLRTSEYKDATSNFINYVGSYAPQQH